MIYPSRLARMKGWQRFLLLFLVVLFIFKLSDWVETVNHANLIYIDTTRDNFESGEQAVLLTFFCAILSLPLLAIVACIPVSWRVQRLITRAAGWRAIILAILLPTYVVLASLCLFGFTYWFVHDHYWISGGYVIPLSLITVLCWQDTKALFPRAYLVWFLLYFAVLGVLGERLWSHGPRLGGMWPTSEELASRGFVGYGTTLSFAIGEDGTRYLGTLKHGIFMTKDKGNTWQYISKDIPDRDESIYALSIHAGVIYARTIKNVYVSTDNGGHWTYMGGVPERFSENEPYSKVYLRAFVVGPDGVLYVGTKNGVYKSPDKGLHWLEAGKSQKVLANFLAVDPSGGVYAVTQKGILKSSDNGESWSEISKTTLDTDGYIAWAPSGALYAGNFLNFTKSLDQGMSWGGAGASQAFIEGISSPTGRAGRGWPRGSERFIYDIRGLVVAPDGTLLVLTQWGLCQSADDGATWTAWSPKGKVASDVCDISGAAASRAKR